MLSIEKFIGNKEKLKGFFIQIKTKIVNKSLGLLIPVKQVAYIKLFLIKRALE